jgi:hypothetical protein
MSSSSLSNSSSSSSSVWSNPAIIAVTGLAATGALVGATAAIIPRSKKNNLSKAPPQSTVPAAPSMNVDTISAASENASAQQSPFIREDSSERQSAQNSASDTDSAGVMGSGSDGTTHVSTSSTTAPSWRWGR